MYLDHTKVRQWSSIYMTFDLQSKTQEINFATVRSSPKTNLNKYRLSSSIYKEDAYLHFTLMKLGIAIAWKNCGVIEYLAQFQIL